MTGGSVITAPVTPTRLTSAMAAQVQDLFTLEDVDPIGRIEAMIYSPPGAGKTVMASTFRPPFRWIAADGMNCLKSVRWAYKAGLTAIKDFKDLVGYAPTELIKGKYIDAPRAFNLMQDMIDYWFKPEQVGSWQTLVLDSLTEINTWALDQGLSLNVRLPKADKPLSKSDTYNRQAMARIIVGEQDYKSGMGLIEGFIRNIRSECARHGKDLVVLCHEYKDEFVDHEHDDSIIVRSIQPLLTGQLRTRIVKDFDDVWHLEKFNTTKGVEVSVDMHGDTKTIAKSRWGNVMPRRVDADFRKILEEVRKFHAA